VDAAGQQTEEECIVQGHSHQRAVRQCNFCIQAHEQAVLGDLRGGNELPQAGQRSAHSRPCFTKQPPALPMPLALHLIAEWLNLGQQPLVKQGMLCCCLCLLKTVEVDHPLGLTNLGQVASRPVLADNVAAGSLLQ